MNVLLNEPGGVEFFTSFDHICVTDNQIYEVSSRSVIETNPALCHAYVCTERCLDLHGREGCKHVLQPPINGIDLCIWGNGFESCRNSCDRCYAPCQGEWSDVSECSATCGHGVTTQTWNVIQVRETGGGSCPYGDLETHQEECFLQPCKTCVLDRDQIIYDLGTTSSPTQLPSQAPTMSDPEPIVILTDWSTKGYINEAAYGTAFTDGSGINAGDCENQGPKYGIGENEVLNGDRCFVNINDGVEDDVEENDDSAWSPSGSEGYVGVKLTAEMPVTAIRISRHYTHGLEGLVGVSRTLDDFDTYDGGEWELLTHVNQTDLGNYYVVFDPPIDATAIKLNVSSMHHVIDELQIWVADPQGSYLAGFYTLMGEMGIIDRSGNENDLVNYYNVDLGGEQGEGMQFREVSNYVQIKNDHISGTSYSIAIEFGPESPNLVGPIQYFVEAQGSKGAGMEQEREHVKVELKAEGDDDDVLSMYARDTLTHALEYYKIVLVVSQHEQWLYVDDVLYDHRHVRFTNEFDINKDAYLGWYPGSAGKIVGRLRCLKMWRGMISDEEVSSAFDDCVYQPVSEWESASRVKCTDFDFVPLPDYAEITEASPALCQTWCERQGDSCYGTFFYEAGAPIRASEREGCYLCSQGLTDFPQNYNYVLRKPVQVWPEWQLVYWEVDGALVFDLGEESTNKLFQDSRFHVLRYDKDGAPWGVYRRYTELDTFQVYDIITGPWLSSLGKESDGDFHIYDTLEHALMDYPRLGNCGQYDEPGVGFPGSCGLDAYSYHDVEGSNIYAQNTVGFWIGIVQDVNALEVGDIKLRGGDGIRYGIVMYWNGLQYGTVCLDADHAHSGVADVICRSLGFEDGGDFCHSPGYTSSDKSCTFAWPDLNEEGTLPGLMVDGRYCTGDEERIEDCPDYNGYLANCNANQEIGVICSLGSDELIDPIDNAYAAEWEHFPDWVIESGTYPCQYYIYNNGTENPDNVTYIDNLLDTGVNASTIDIALERCRYMPMCSMVTYNATTLEVEYCKLPPNRFDPTMVLQEHIGTDWYGYLETSAITGAWGYTLSRGYSIPESKIGHVEIDGEGKTSITKPKDCADICDAMDDCSAFTFPESAYKPRCTFLTNYGNPLFDRQEEHYIDYYVKADRRFSFKAAIITYTYSEFGLMPVINFEDTQPPDPLADPAILTIVFSEEEMAQDGGLTLTPVGNVVVNPEGEAIFKGEGYFLLDGDFSSWGPSLTICFESRQYVTGRDENIFMMEAHDHFHEGFRQLSIHMPSPATDYKVIFDAGSNSNYITKVDWNRVDSESKLLGRWVSFCFVKDYEGKKLDIYRNREILATSNFTLTGDSYPLDLSKVSRIGIGGPVLYGDADDDQVYIGELRNFRVWNTAFTDRQVKYYQKPIRQYDPILETKFSDLTLPGAIYNYSTTIVTHGRGGPGDPPLMQLNDFGTYVYTNDPEAHITDPFFTIEGPLDFAESSLTVCFNAAFGEIGIGPEPTDPDISLAEPPDRTNANENLLGDLPPRWDSMESKYWQFPLIQMTPLDNELHKFIKIFYPLEFVYKVEHQLYQTYFIAIEMIDENHRLLVDIKEFMGAWTNYCFVKDDHRRSMYLTINGEVAAAETIRYYFYHDPTPQDLSDNPVDHTQAFYTKSWQSIKTHAWARGDTTAPMTFAYRDLKIWDRVIDPYTLSSLRFVIPDSILGIQFTTGEDRAHVNITQNTLLEVTETHGDLIFDNNMVTLEGHGHLDYSLENSVSLSSYTICMVIDQHQVPTSPYPYPESMMILDFGTITFEAATPETDQTLRWTNKAFHIGNDPNNDFWHADLYGISPDRKQSICAVQDFGASRYRMYLNGLIGAQGPIEQILPAAIDSLRIGKDADGGRAFMGSIQSVNLWNAALSPERIYEIHMRQMDLFATQLWTTVYTTDVGIWHTMDDPDLDALYIPQCDASGLYVNKQCDHSNFCWCVHRQDRTVKLPGEGIDQYLTCSAPSTFPSNSPSKGPTVCPSFGPSVQPSRNPSFSPSFTPSVDPSVSPSTSPSVGPSAVPTTIPTVIPTFIPTMVPTMQPTTSPSTCPTQAPTSSPTDHPTTTPTTNPSTKPTTAPSTSPSTSPTTSPTSPPTDRPTWGPTPAPTFAPTEVPTLTPTREPTFSPTFLDDDWVTTSLNITFYLGGIRYAEFQAIEESFFYIILPRVLDIRPVHVRDYYYFESSAEILDVHVELMMSDYSHAQRIMDAVILPNFDLAMNEEIVETYGDATPSFYVIGNFEAAVPQTTPAPTTGGAYTCGSTMEECEAAYLAASTPAISVMEPTMTLDGCDELDSSWVNNVVNGLSGWDSDSMKLCANNGQYAVEVDGMVYPTCVAYGTQGTACTDDSLVCPDRNADPGVFGYAGNVRNALSSSMTRADFGHPQCPTATCLTMDSVAESNRYWKDQVLNQPFTEVTEAQVDALCVNEDNQVMFVTREGKCNTCIGWSTDATAQCESGKFLCAGHSGEGEFTYGWPGQIARTLAVAAVNADGMYMHPQCPLMICKA